MSVPNQPDANTVQLPFVFRKTNVGIWYGLLFCLALIILFIATAIYVGDDRSHPVALEFFFAGFLCLAIFAWAFFRKYPVAAVVTKEGIIYHGWRPKNFARREPVFFKWNEIVNISVQQETIKRRQNSDHTTVTFYFRSTQSLPFVMNVRSMDGKKFAALVTACLKTFGGAPCVAPAEMRNAAGIATMPAFPIDIYFSIYKGVELIIICGGPCFLCIGMTIQWLTGKLEEMDQRWKAAPITNSLIGILVICVLGATAWQFFCGVFKVFDRRPQIILNESGLSYRRREFSLKAWRDFFRTPGPVFIKWQEISRLRLQTGFQRGIYGLEGFTYDANIYVTFLPVVPANFSTPQTPPALRPPLVLNVNALTKKPETIFLLMQAKSLNQFDPIRPGPGGSLQRLND